VATLSAAGEPLAGAEVIFSLNGSAVGIATTDASGVATLAGVSVVGIPVGTGAGAISASFAGNDNVLGSTASADLTVLFVDVTPPVLQLPGKLTVNATSPLGATVNYLVTATDNSGKPVTISCSPLSGSVFPIGTTDVNCTATDQAGNVAIGKFSVKVLSAAEQLVALVEKLRGMPISSVIKTLLVGYLETALANPKKVSLVCTTLDYFVSFVKRYASPTLQPVLIADTRRIQAVLGCQ
jgi:HYR domain